ncbi:MAG: serine/threonine-protein phosphatase [Bacteroidales bacterium]|nr:serine/threonine-protein phosphatase [Bacteroidales bacterium]
MMVLRYIAVLSLVMVAFCSSVRAADTTGVSRSEQSQTVKKAEYLRKLSENYEKQGDYRRADSVFSLYADFQKNFFDEAAMKDLTNMKKAQTDAEQNALQEKEIQRINMVHAMDQKRIRIIMIAVIIGIGLTVFLAGFIFQLIRIKRRANNQLTKANNELALQRQEIEHQCDLIAESKEELTNANDQIINSIKYARMIQQAAIASAGNYGSLFPESFVFFRPKNIVSGDFFFASQCGRLKVFVVADCTGHGIPGGFLSMLGISAVKEFLTTEDTAQHPGIVLDKLKTFVKSTLNPHDGMSAMEDGMDMTICSFDFEKRIMYYATANQTALLVRKGTPHKLKGNPMPVGKYYLEAGCFSSLQQQLEPGDMVYLYTDGFQDQLGGDKAHPVGRKLYSKNLIDFLCHHYFLSVEEQKEQLDEFMSQWSNSRDQTDDMTLAAVRVQ